MMQRLMDSPRLQIFIVIFGVAVLIVSLAYSNIQTRRMLRKAANVVEDMERSVQLLETVTLQLASDFRLANSERELQHSLQINQLRRGQRCIIYAELSPTSAWTDEAIQKCLREGILPRGIAPR